VLIRTDNKVLSAVLPAVERVIKHVTKFICTTCSKGPFSEDDASVLLLYQAFYRRLIYRDRTLPRPWVFTTNYDLFNETALDRLGIQYCNGFAGTVERRFNPATYRYALAEQLDVSSTRWSSVDGYMYFCKLHGSINWEEDNVGLFPIRECTGNIAEPTGTVMIFPTPAKQNLSFGTPYSDLFREFQSRVGREQSVLIAIGYGFGDEHVNNLIFQALTIPTFRLIAFVQPDCNTTMQSLRALNDPRIWIIGGHPATGGRKAHYFDTVVERFMPHAPGNQVDSAVERILTELLGPARSQAQKSDEAPNAHG
jgi:SIR2-like domain